MSSSPVNILSVLILLTGSLVSCQLSSLKSILDLFTYHCIIKGLRIIIINCKYVLGCIWAQETVLVQGLGHDSQ